MQHIISRQSRQRRIVINIPNAFTLASPKRISIGVFLGDVLLRTLSSAVEYTAGTHSINQVWDYRDDEGNLLPDNPNYHIEVAETGATYEFLGTVGNTSQDKGGIWTYRTGEHIMGMTVCDGKAWVISGYVEGEPTHAYFELSNPHRRIETFPQEGNAWHLIDHDDTLIYFGGTDHGSETVQTKYGIVATNRSNNAQATLAGGTAWATNGVDLDYTSAVNLGTTPIRGLAVQKTGNYYAISLPTLNIIRIFNKTSGASVDYSLTSPRNLAFSTDGTALWAITDVNTVAKYAVSAGGVLTITPSLTLSGLDTPIYLAISPTTGAVAVADAGTRQQVRFFNPTTGAEGTALGQLGGYINSEVAAPDKFMFKYTKDYKPVPDDGDGHPYIAFEPDGSIWVGESGCLRSQHFSLSGTPALIDTIQFMGYQYSAFANPVEPHRVFSGYQEFHVDHSKPSVEPGNGSWTYVANWGQNIAQTIDDEYMRLKDVTTLSNGRTYALARKDNPGSTPDVFVEVELVPNFGVRLTGNETPSLLWAMFSDGSWWASGGNALGVTSSMSKRAVTGFDGNNNPIRSNAVVQVTTPVVTASDPLKSGGLMRRNTLTSSNILLTFSNDKYNSGSGRGGGYHVGGLKLGESGYKFRIAPSTYEDYIGEYPEDNRYDIGNDINNGGGSIQAVGRHCIWNFYGENWKLSQTNKFHHFYDNGLYLGTFGMTRTEALDIGEATPGMEGNAQNFTLLDVGGGKIRLVHGGEFFRGGPSVWEIANLDVVIHSFPFPKVGDTPNLATPDYIDLMEGLPYHSVVANNTAGWTRSPATEGASTGFNLYSVRTNRATYQKNRRDLYIDFDASVNGQTSTVSRALGVGVLSSWRMTGKLAYPDSSETGDNFIQILDDEGRVIFQFSRPQLTGSTTAVKANSTSIAEGSYTVMRRSTRKLQPFSIQKSGASLIVTYANFAPVSVSVLDPLADATRPTTLRNYMHSPATQGHSCILADLHLYTS